MAKDILIPDLGGATSVEVIEILVDVGDTVKIEDSLITLESDKASMDVPSPYAGKIQEIKVNLSDTVKDGDVLATIEIAQDGEDIGSQQQQQQEEQAPNVIEPSTAADINNQEKLAGLVNKTTNHAELIVIGSGPGGYTAAFRAADLGLSVTLIERYPQLGGVCLNVGCIPSKALLHSASVITEAAAMADHGIVFDKPKIDIPKLRGFKESVVSQLTGGLSSMAKARKVNVIQGYAKFTSPNTVSIDNGQSLSNLSFDKAIIAVGSSVTILPDFALDDPRVIDSTGALELSSIPNSMLIIGGGIIGLEMATVYSALGTEVSIVEFMPQLMPGADKDLIAPLQKRLKASVKSIMTGTKVKNIKPKNSGIYVEFDHDNGDAPKAETYDIVLLATGRTPNGKHIDIDKAGVNVDERGFIKVDKQMRSNVEHIFAIGDVVGQPMLAHKATHEAKVAAQVCAGHKSEFDAQVIPSVAYTDPEVAWVGLTETQAKQDNIDYKVGKFPWAASGRAIGNARTEGKTKILFDPKTHRVLGGGIVGTNAGDLIAEISFAIEMGSDATDLGLTIHPHPTLSETVAMAAEVYEGTITDLYIPKK